MNIFGCLWCADNRNDMFTELIFWKLKGLDIHSIIWSIYLGWIEINVWLSFLIWRYYHDVKIYRDLVLVNVCVEIFNKPLPSTNFACTNCNTGKFAFRLLCSFCWLKNTFLRKTILHEMWKEEDNDSFMKFWLIICVIMVFMVSIMT